MIHIIRNAEIYSPEKRGYGNLVTAFGQILYLGKDLPDIAPELIESDMDAEGGMLVPGFIDGHVHITGGGGEAGFSSKVPALGLSDYTLAGVTSVIGLLGTDDLTRSTYSLVGQAYALREEGMSAWCYTGGYHLPAQTLTGDIRGDIVGVDPILGFGELAVSDHRSSQPTIEEFLRVASEVYVAGLMTGKAGVFHLHMGDGPRQFDLIEQALDQAEIPARTYMPTHVNRRKSLYDAALSLPEKGVVIDVTAMPDELCGKGYTALEAFEKYQDRNLPADKLTISSDAGGSLPVFNAQGEMVKMGIGSSIILSQSLGKFLAAGHAMEKALPAFTSNVAQALRLHHKGRLDKGMDADLVLLHPDCTIRHVMARGVWHVKDGKAVKTGRFETGRFETGGFE